MVRQSRSRNTPDPATPQHESRKSRSGTIGRPALFASTIATRHATVVAVFGMAAAMAESMPAMPSIVVPVVLITATVPIVAASIVVPFVPPMVVAIVASLLMAAAVVILGIGDGRGAQAGDDQTRGREHACDLHGSSPVPASGSDWLRSGGGIVPQLSRASQSEEEDRRNARPDLDGHGDQIVSRSER